VILLTRCDAGELAAAYCFAAWSRASAAAVGLSPRPLERRLARHGTSFTRLLDTLRADLARQYLADTDFRLEQIAYLVGYSEPAALVRAFRRWTGTTPAAFRAGRARQAD